MRSVAFLFFSFAAAKLPSHTLHQLHWLAEFPLRRKLVKRTSLAVILFVFLCLPLLAQQLQLTGLDGKSVIVTAADLKAMPRHSVTAINGHTKAQEKYEGVLLSDLLAKVGAPLGDKFRGKAVMVYVNAGASDNYHALLALAEVDQGVHPNENIVADTMDGKPLDAKQGPLKLVVPGDKLPSRSARMITSIVLVQAP